VAELKPLVWEADPWGFAAMECPDDEYDGLLSALMSRLVADEGADGVVRAVRDKDPLGPSMGGIPQRLSAFAAQRGLVWRVPASARGRVAESVQWP
jgi:hypothetical protein